MYGLHQRWLQIRNKLHGDIYTRLTARSYVQDSRTVTRRKEFVTEVRLVETNQAFRHLQECMDWVQEKVVRFLVICCKYK